GTLDIRDGEETLDTTGLRLRNHRRQRIGHLLDPNLRNLDVTVLVFDTDGDVIGVHARLRLEPSVRQSAREDEPILDGSQNRVALARPQTISTRMVPSPP